MKQHFMLSRRSCYRRCGDVVGVAPLQAPKDAGRIALARAASERPFVAHSTCDFASHTPAWQSMEAWTFMNHRNAIWFAVPILLFAIGGLADDKPPSGKEINALIGQLVSPNPAPDVAYGTVKYPKGFDHDAQKRVYHAWSELSRIGIRAFPYMINYFDDNRYCFTRDSGSGYYNWSVGRACADIFICHLQPYDFASHFAL